MKYPPKISCLICYFWKSGKIWNCCLLQIIGGPLRVKIWNACHRLLISFLSDSCKVSVDLPSLPSYMSCQLSSSCTQIQCCMNIESIGRSFQVNFNIDPCTYSLKTEIEGFDNKELLFDFSWGVEQHFWLFGLVRLEWVIIWHLHIVFLAFWEYDLTPRIGNFLDCFIQN